jgi:N-acetylmuramoyl-L-alanine amidase
MWSLIELAYDLAFQILKTADHVKWEALVGYTIYQLGRRNGMRLFRKYLEGHFPHLISEDVQWKLWVMKQIEALGGTPFTPKKHYSSGKKSKRTAAPKSETSSTSSRQVINQEELMRKEVYNVVLDAGHGGSDPGAIGTMKTKEKDFNLSMVFKVETLLKKNPNLNVVLTRVNDTFIELTDRAKIANRIPADIFLSIHANATSNSATGGTEALYTKDIDKPLSDIIQAHILPVTGFADRKSKYQNLAVCRNTKMPACLIEPGFLTNPKEEGLLLDETFQNTLAEAVARGICAYLGVDYGARVTPKGTFPLDVELSGIVFEGLLIDSKSWIPAKLILTALGLQWSYSLRKIYIGDNALETKIYDGTSYIKATDLKALDVVRNVMLDPDATNTKRVLIYPKGETL